MPHECKSGRSFAGVLAYASHDADRAQTSDRVDWMMCLNLDLGPDLRPPDPAHAARVMAATAASASGLKAAAGIKATGRKLEKPVYHFTLSWQDGYRPSPREREQAVTGSLKTLGLEDHQAYVVGHTDHDHYHLHVVVNRVSMVDGRAAKLHRSKSRLQRWALEFEEEYPNPKPVKNRGIRTRTWVENRAIVNQARDEALARGLGPADVSVAVERARRRRRPMPRAEPRARWDRCRQARVEPLPGEAQAWPTARTRPQRRELSRCLNQVRQEHDAQRTVLEADRRRVDRLAAVPPVRDLPAPARQPEPERPWPVERADREAAEQERVREAAAAEQQERAAREAAAAREEQARNIRPRFEDEISYTGRSAAEQKGYALAEKFRGVAWDYVEAEVEEATGSAISPYEATLGVDIASLDLADTIFDAAQRASQRGRNAEPSIVSAAAAEVRQAVTAIIGECRRKAGEPPDQGTLAAADQARPAQTATASAAARTTNPAPAPARRPEPERPGPAQPPERPLPAPAPADSIGAMKTPMRGEGAPPGGSQPPTRQRDNRTR